MSETPIRILLIGSGGRESALAWKLDQSPRTEKIFVVPGNGGTAAGLAKVSNIDDIQADDYPGLVRLALKLKINLVIPGPDQAVVDGIEGYFRAVEIPCFAPSREAAQVEGSKAFSKDFMARHNIPTADYGLFSNFESAEKYVRGVSHKVVVKASGLAAGKGVILPESEEEAVQALREIMLERKFGDAGKEVVIEEFLEGDELSILTFCDGKNFKSLPAAQDHKRAFDGDKGPNTGGMGCYAPSSIMSGALLTQVEKTILGPTLDGLRQEGIPFVGLLFTGLMITASGPKVLEYNARFGDPETQTLIPLVSEKTDLVDVMLSCVEKRLDLIQLEIRKDKSSVVVVVASGGYPGAHRKGLQIQIDEQPKGMSSPLASLLSTANQFDSGVPGTLIFFHAGTALKDGILRTSGGRVIAVSATANNLNEALQTAYAGVSTIQFEDAFFRSDIAHR